MSQDALRQVLERLDAASNGRFTSDDVTAWAPGQHEALVAAGVLLAGAASPVVICDGCHERCQEDVEFVDEEDAPLRAYVVCHARDLGRVQVPLDRLAVWTPSTDGLTRWVADQLAVTSEPEECLPGRLWWLGRPTLATTRVDVFLARGATWADAGGVFAKAVRLTECSRPVVLVPWDVPKSSPFTPETIVLSLQRLLTLDDGSLSLDVAEIGEASGARRTAGLRVLVPFPTPPGTVWEQVTIQVFNNREVVISTGGAQEARSFEEMGFTDRRSGKPDASWALLLLIAKQGGSLSWDDPIAREELLKRKKLVSNLRKALKAAFGLKANPIPYNRQTHAYEVKFVIRDKRRASR